MKTALLLLLLFVTACGPIIEQEVRDIGRDSYVLATTSYYEHGFKPIKSLSYQLVYFNQKFDLEWHDACDVWFTQGPLTDSIKSAQKEFAENKVREYENIMK